MLKKGYVYMFFMFAAVMLMFWGIPLAVDAQTETGTLGLIVSGDTITDYTGSATELEIPDMINGVKITAIGDSAFKGCKSLTCISIPNSVTYILSNAFSDCTNLTNVSMPDNVTEIGSGAFLNCSSLTCINIPASIRSINFSVFDGCSSLISVNIPDNVTTIDAFSFNGCSSLVSVNIPESATNIGWNAFSGCSSLVSISIPASVIKIDSLAFMGCSKLTEINVDSANPQYMSKNGILFSKDKKILYTYPCGKNDETYVIPDSVKSVYTFFECCNLVKVVIPASLTDINSRSFSGCTKLREINVDSNNPQFMSKEGVLFSKDGTILLKYPAGNTAETFTLPESVKNIALYAFFRCSSLSDVSIPDTVTWIGESAFEGCINLTNIVIPSSVTRLDYSVFKDCTSLSRITLPNSIIRINGWMFYGCRSLISISIPDGISGIDIGAFSRCSSLTNIKIPNSINYIDREAFKGCSSLISITIPDKVKEIRSNTFSGCSSLASITIPVSVEQIEDNVFTDCDKLTISGHKVSYAQIYSILHKTPFMDIETGSLIEVVESDFRFDYIHGEITGYNGTATMIDIPAKINGFTVKAIGAHAFSYCSSITSVNIPDSVMVISDCAFWKCSSLTSISIPVSVTSIGKNAFDKCSNLTGLIIPDSVKSIGDYAFLNCSNLTSVVIPNSVTNISDYTFIGCDKLTIFFDEGSYAQTYAAHNKIPYKVLGYINLRGTIEPDFTYSASNCAIIKKGFKVEIIEQPVSAYTDDYGNFELNIPNYITVCDIKITKPGYLSKEIKNTPANQDVQLSPIGMWAGDMNGDNTINMVDIMEVAKAFNSIVGDKTFISDCDFNKDGAINLMDIMIVAKHFNSICC